MVTGCVWRQKLRARDGWNQRAAAAVPVALGAARRAGPGHRGGHAVYGCLWAAVETRTLIQRHGGEGIVWIPVLARGLAGLAEGGGDLLVQVKGETANWGSRAAT